VAPETLFRLAADVSGIAGVKEASGSLPQVMTILCDRPAGFTVLSGEDDLTFVLMALGAEGVISVAANEVPAAMAALCDAALAGRMERALTLHWRLLPLLRANFIETNPIPVKTGMEILGHFDAHFRLPLVPLSEGLRPALEDALRAAGAFDEIGAPIGPER
jgi:4-hydroxy-tetrahydrodipicolinate synthase